MSSGLAPRALSMILILAGVIFLALAAAMGEIEFAIVLIFPIIWGSGIFAVLGILLIFLGFFLGITTFHFRSVATDVKREPRFQEGGRAKGAGVILIGPIPIVLGSDKTSTILVISLAIVLMILAILWFLL
jgi:uncharacterized protein (TIGR00304 family)